MVRRRRHSSQTVAVLLALAAEPNRWRFGYDLCRDTGLESGSIYPILMRLADRGLLASKWESDAPAGRPPRHVYRLTAAGRADAAQLADVMPARGARLRSQLGGAS